MIPKILHFCFGLSSQGGGDWGLVHYACVRSAVERIKPDRAFLYFEYTPRGPYWDLTTKILDCQKITAPRSVFGNPLLHYAHRADVLRLEKLIAIGGIYLDCDVFVHRNFDDLLDNSVVLGQEGEKGEFGLCNAVILAHRFCGGGTQSMGAFVQGGTTSSGASTRSTCRANSPRAIVAN